MVAGHLKLRAKHIKPWNALRAGFKQTMPNLDLDHPLFWQVRYHEAQQNTWLLF